MLQILGLHDEAHRIDQLTEKLYYDLACDLDEDGEENSPTCDGDSCIRCKAIRRIEGDKAVRR